MLRPCEIRSSIHEAAPHGASDGPVRAVGIIAAGRFAVGIAEIEFRKVAMQMLLAALGGCSAIDLVNILKKQKQSLDDIKITITGERESGAIPSLYRQVHAHFKLYGNIDPDKTAKAVSLAVDKYCSVARTLAAHARVTHSFEIFSPVK